MRLLFLFVSIIILSVGCTPTPTDDAAAPDAHSSKNSLDWEGKYSGKIPCPDCDATLTTLFLSSQNKYKLSTTSVGKDEKAFFEEGTFTWDESGSIIRLNDGNGQAYQVIENGLMHLDKGGNKFEGDIAPRYQLYKGHMNAALEEPKWLLYEIAGTMLDTAVISSIPSLKFNTMNERFSGKSCNTYFGTYKLEHGGRIKFSGIGSSKMTCEEQGYSKEIMQSLKLADRYTIVGNQLSVGNESNSSALRFTRSAK